LIAATALNLYPDPIHLVDFRIQGIYNNGDGDATLVAPDPSPNSTFRVRSIRGLAALRYQFSKSMIPTFQVAATGGYASYFDTAAANSWGGTINGFYNLGSHFVVGVQYLLRRDSQLLRSALGTPEFGHSVQAVLRFGFEFTVNALPNRDSILNNEHSYIP